MARASFQQELDQIRLQIELMAARVGVALDRMQEVLDTGDADVAALAVAADDQVDAMHVSLTERTYDLIRRESPVATDLRYLVSVLRVLEELERVADLSLRVVKQAAEVPSIARHGQVLERLQEMAAIDRYAFRQALDAWAAEDPTLAADLAVQCAEMRHAYGALLAELRRLEGPGSTGVAVNAVLMGQALERIVDHTVIVGERLGYLLTGDTSYLASEVR